MNYDIFKNDEERKNAIQRLIELQQSEGWQILVKALDINHAHFQEELNTEHFIDLRPVERLQDRLSDLYNLKQLPILLVKEAKEKLDQEEPDEDPDVYESPAADTNPN